MLNYLSFGALWVLFFPCPSCLLYFQSSFPFLLFLVFGHYPEIICQRQRKEIKSTFSILTQFQYNHLIACCVWFSHPRTSSKLSFDRSSTISSQAIPYQYDYQELFVLIFGTKMKNVLQPTKAKIIINLKQLGDNFGNFGNLRSSLHLSA